MEQVVKDMSHLFQFFPDEVAPLEYPDSIELIDNAGSQLTHMFHFTIQL